MKKKWKRLLSIITAMILVVCMGTECFADQISDLKKKNEEDQKKLDNVGSKLDNLADEQQVVVEQMDDLEAQIVDLMTSISILEDEIVEKKAEIEQAKIDLDKAIADEKAQYEAMKVRIKYMYENGDSSYLDNLLQAASLDDILNRADYIERLYDYDRKMLIQYQDARKLVEDLKTNLEIEESELEVSQQECEAEKADMEVVLEELKKQNADYEAKISQAKQEAAAYKAQIKAANAQIAKLEEEERKKAEEAARKAAQAAAANNKTSSSTTSSTTTAVGTATVNKAAIMAANGSDQGKQIAIYACGFVGNPYVSGGTSLTNGADCSGFTQSVYRAYGYNIPRTSFQQREAGTEVSYAEAQPGDIICYAGHVAMYIGNGQIVHASSPATGIKIGSATYKQIITVRRIIS